MARAQGAQPTRQFTRHHAHKRNRAQISTDQHLEMQGWGQGTKATVDVQRANWRGILYVQQQCGVFDPRPRLVKRGN